MNINLSVDYLPVLKTMVDYLLMVNSVGGDVRIDQRTAGFKLGRATGHTNCAHQLCAYLNRRGTRAVILTERRMITQGDMLGDCTIPLDVYLRGGYKPFDVIIIDPWAIINGRGNVMGELYQTEYGNNRPVYLQIQ